MSLNVSLVGTLPVTGGTVGAPLIGGFGEIAAHFVGADARAVLLVVGLGDFPGVTFALPDPPVNTVKVRIRSTATTIAVPLTAPTIVLRRFAAARRSSSA